MKAALTANSLLRENASAGIAEDWAKGFKSARKVG
jgi:hypothetical protein